MPWGSIEDPGYRLSVVVSWKVVAEIMRRHYPERDLQVMELHPGGGLYDCLSLITGLHGRIGRSLCQINRVGSLHIIESWASPRARIDAEPWTRYANGSLNYVAAWVAMASARDFIYQLEDVLGLPSTRSLPTPPTVPTTLVFRVLAGLQERWVVGNDWLEIRSVCYDSSGMVESGIREELARFPNAHAEVSRNEGWLQIEQAIQYWLLILVRSSQPESVVTLLDTRGQLFWVNRPTEAYDLYTAYERHARHLAALVIDLEREMSEVAQSI